jgi:tRNA1(Val) A37 N6-methylase TrmN6
MKGRIPEAVGYQKDRSTNSDAQKILEIGSAESAQTLLLADQFPKANITAIEIYSNALRRAEDNLKPFADGIELINADIAEYGISTAAYKRQLMREYS